MVKCLIDAGPLIALIDPKDPGHLRCVGCLPQLSLPLITTWPAFTEAMYFAHRLGGWNSQRFLWRFLDQGTVEMHVPALPEQQRMRVAMERYSDTPMDLADASVVAAAEALEIYSVFTLDSHFRVYRTDSGKAFDVLPAAP